MAEIIPRPAGEARILSHKNFPTACDSIQKTFENQWEKLFRRLRQCTARSPLPAAFRSNGNMAAAKRAKTGRVDATSSRIRL
jgi:hypothetical protein